eukprot:m.289561 g.289561  ORF g.289561 m.289561 type:complete len:298 (+) comp19968_c0_seq1:84-977(+)
MSGRLEGKVAVITGGTSGIGLASVKLFIQEGCKVVFCGRGANAGRRISESAGKNCVFVQCDVNDESQVKAVIDAAISRWGKLDILFNNAGGSVGFPLASVAQVTEDDINATFSLNFNSMCYGIKHAVPHLMKQRTSSIINNSSVAAKKSGFGDALYSAAKSAMDAYGRVAAMELAPQGIRVNSLSPGATATPIFWGGSPGHIRGRTLTEKDNAVRQKKVEDNIVNNVTPLRIGRSGTGVDIARAAVFLASDDSEWITGQDMIVDGGMTAFDWPNKGWMADTPARDPVPLRHKLFSKL